MTLRMLARPAARVGPIALVAMLCLAGCGDSAGAGSGPGATGRDAAAGGPPSPAGSTASGGGSSDPCTILTAADVRAAFGGTVSAGSAQNPDLVTGPSCTYHIKGAALGKEADAYVVLPRDETPYQIELIKKYPDANEKIVPGVGDFASYVSYANTLAFVKHGTVIDVAATQVGYEGKSVNPPQPPHFEASLIALAKRVAARA